MKAVIMTGEGSAYSLPAINLTDGAGDEPPLMEYTVELLRLHGLRDVL